MEVGWRGAYPEDSHQTTGIDKGILVIHLLGEVVDNVHVVAVDRILAVVRRFGGVGAVASQILIQEPSHRGIAMERTQFPIDKCLERENEGTRKKIRKKKRNINK